MSRYSGFMKIIVLKVQMFVVPGRYEAPVLVRAVDRAGHLVGGGQAADTERHLLVHHQALPLLPHR